MYSNGFADFTDGDTFKRITIPCDQVTVTTPILVGCILDTVATDDDPGWTFHATVVSRGAGTFDVNVAALNLGEPPVNDEVPNTHVEVVYFIP